MQKIFKLPAAEAQKIAAGEVVERPASVVKELVENSLDAGATHLTIHVKNGGKEYLQIIDDGCGMSAVDARLCIEQYATSKIRSVNDLSSLATFGFRGEALSSIAAVSCLTIVTREPSQEHGIKLTIENGTIHEEIVACNSGTIITVENLYYNVPARKKFLKTRETEWRAILQLLQALCLAYPHCSFKIFHENNLILNCPRAAHDKERIHQLFGHQLSERLLESSAHDDATKTSITGLISSIQYTRYDRSQIFILVNKRWIKNYKLSQAIMKGYGNRLVKDRFPAAFIAIEIDPQQIDINIHPRKEEVQFLNPRKVETLIEEMIADLLQKTMAQHLPTHTLPLQQTASINNFLPTYPIAAPLNHHTFAPYQTETSLPLKNNVVEQKRFEHVIEKAFTFQEEHKEQLPLINPEQSAYQLIGQLHKTYILLETDKGLLLIDQHAAHERILYEQFATRFYECALVKLIFPEIITLTPDDCKLLTSFQDILQTHHIMIELYGDNQIMIQSVPVYLKNQSVVDIIHYTLACAQQHQNLSPQELSKKLHESLQAQMACKAAVKAGDVLTLEKMHELIHLLEKTPNKSTCPHGRPTSWLIALHELEKMFRRKL